MNKKRKILFVWFALWGIFFVLLSMNVVFSEIRINEVELNPFGEDNKNEWVEIYSEENVEITNWQIRSNNGKNMSFNASFLNNYFFVLNTTYNLLTNNENTIYLYDNNSNLIFTASNLSDSYNDGKTWQYCNLIGEWKFNVNTFGRENNCSLINEDNQNENNNSKINETENSQTNDNELDKENEEEGDEIYMELDWNKKEIIAGEEFEIEVRVFNCKKGDYDIKIWLEDEDGKIITEIYDEENEKWINGNYYFKDFMSLSSFSEEENENIKIRLKEDKNNSLGDFEIFGKLRKGGKVIADYSDDMEILNKVKEKEEEEEKKETLIVNQNLQISGQTYNESYEEETIRLGLTGNAISLVEEDNSRIYKSKNEYIKEYAVLAFTILSMLIMGGILISLLKKNKDIEKNG